MGIVLNISDFPHLLAKRERARMSLISLDESVQENDTPVLSSDNEVEASKKIKTERLRDLILGFQ